MSYNYFTICSFHLKNVRHSQVSTGYILIHIGIFHIVLHNRFNQFLSAWLICCLKFFLTNNATVASISLVILHKNEHTCDSDFLKWHCWVKRYVVCVYLTLTFSLSLKPTFPSKSPQMWQTGLLVFTGECLPALLVWKPSSAPDPSSSSCSCLPASLLLVSIPYTGYCPSPALDLPPGCLCIRFSQSCHHICTAQVKWLIVSPCTQNCSGLGNKLNHHSIPLWKTSHVAQLH